MHRNQQRAATLIHTAVTTKLSVIYIYSSSNVGSSDARRLVGCPSSRPHVQITAARITASVDIEALQRLSVILMYETALKRRGEFFFGDTLGWFPVQEQGSQDITELSKIDMDLDGVAGGCWGFLGVAGSYWSCWELLVVTGKLDQSWPELSRYAQSCSELSQNPEVDLVW